MEKPLSSKYKLDFSRFDLAELSELRTYESLSESRVQYLVSDIKSRGLVINPLIWDSSFKLLIDGQHRARALRCLGVKYAPVYHTEYMGCEVTVKNWYHTILASSLIAFVKVFDSIKIPKCIKGDGLTWNIIIKGPEGLTLRCTFSDPLEAARELHLICEKYQGLGWSIEIHPKPRPYDTKRYPAFVMFLDPAIGKEQVIGILDSGQLFPPHVNRHLIDHRPLRLKIPLSFLMQSKAQGKSNLLKHLTQSRPILVKAGSWQDGRFY